MPNANREGRIGPFEGLDSHFLWLADLFERLCELSTEAARNEAAAWPADDGYYFDRLRLHFWRKQQVFDGLHVGTQFNELSDEVFWNPYVQRELLHVLRDRWKDFAPTHRRAIETRLLNGRIARAGEPVKDIEKWNAYHCGVTLGWLQRHECALSRKAESRLSMLRRARGLTPEEELSADHDWDGRSGWVTQRREPGNLRSTPVGEIVTQAEASTNIGPSGLVDELPFAGLVEQEPRRAFLALCVARRNGIFPVSLWQQLISHWPTSTSSRLTLACANRLAGLPPESLLVLRHEVTDWLKTYAHNLFSKSESGFSSTWDRIFTGLVASGPEAVESTISYQNEGGVSQAMHTYDSAFNSPIGRLLQALFETLGHDRFERGQLFPSYFRDRIESALSVSGEAHYHVVAMLGSRLHFLFFVDPKWVNGDLLPRFLGDEASSAALWSGVIFDSYRPYPYQLFSRIKTNFLETLSLGSAMLDEDAERQLAGMLMEATFARTRLKRYVSFRECRIALQSMSESGRLSALWTAGQVIKRENAWTSFGKAFFRNAWPREVAFRTSSTTESLIRIATDLDDVFGDVVDTIEEYFTYVDHPDTFLHGLLHDGHKGKTVTLWPEQVLTILTRTIRTDASYKPYQLEQVLERIAESDKRMRSTKRWRSLQDLLSR